MATPLPTKLCAVCGRRFEWRRKWARDWEAVRHCSGACRSRGLGEVDRALEDAILELARARGPSKTLCPSEAARQVAPEGWRALMERSRCAARRLVAAQEIDMLQRGRVVDPSTARGPIRLRLHRRP